MVANSNSNARVIIREKDDQTIIHEYTPLLSKVINNGRKKPDELSTTLSITSKARIGDVISYVEDCVDLTYCSAIWNFQLSCRDERGYDFDPSKHATGTITCSTVAVNDTVTINGKTYTAQAAAKGTDYTKFSQAGTDAQDAADLADSINRDTRVGTEPFAIMATVSGNVVTVIATPSGASGNNVGLSETGSGMTVSGSGTLTGGTDADPASSRFSEATTDRCQGNYQLDFTTTGQEIIIPQISGYYKSGIGTIITNRIDFSKQFDIYIMITPDLVPYSSGTEPIIFSRRETATGKGIEIGLYEIGTTGKWYIKVIENAGFGVGTIKGTSAVVFEEGVTDQTPRWVRVCRNSAGKISLYANGERDVVDGTEPYSLDYPQNGITFGSDYNGTNDYKGKLNHVRIYSGIILDDSQHLAITSQKYQPLIMEFGGRIWERKDKTSTKELKAQSYSKDLNNFKVTLDAITQAKISTVARGEVGSEDAYYTGDQSPTLTNDSTPTGVYLRTESSIYQLFVCGDATNAVDRYDMTGFKLNTAVTTSDTLNLAYNVRDIAFRDNNEFYLLDSSGNNVRKYNMGTAWTLVGSTNVDTFGYGGTTTSAQGLDINTTHLYICDATHIYEFTLGTSWIPSSSTGLTNTLTTSGTTFTGVRVEINGDYIYAIDSTSKKVYKWSLPTPFSLSGAILEETFYVGNEVNTPAGLAIDNAAGNYLITLDSVGDNCNRYRMRTSHTFNAANRYGAGEMDEIIKDLINNLDPTFIVRTKATMPSQWTGTFLADGIFSELVNLLLVRGDLTFYITPRKVLIIEDVIENGTKQKTNHQFYQGDSVTNTDVYRPYKITDTTDNDSILINEITLVGAKDSSGVNITSNIKTTVAGDKPHSLRINVPQISNQTDLDNLRTSIIGLSNVVQKSYKIEAPMDIHHVRYNHLIKIFNAMLNIDGAVDGFFKVESIEQNYPQAGTVLYINQYPINFFELARTETKQLDGLQTESVVPTVIIPPT